MLYIRGSDLYLVDICIELAVLLGSTKAFAVQAPTDASHGTERLAQFKR